MSNGVSISQQAVPVDRAADYQKSLDSRWKTLEIQDEKIIDITFAGSAWITGMNFQKIWASPHGKQLAFETETLTSSGDPNDAPTYYSLPDGIYALVGHFAGSTTRTDRIFLRVYNLDITTEYVAPFSVASKSNTTDKAQFGVRIAKDSKDMDSDDATNFFLTSDAKSFGIHMHGLKVSDLSSSFMVNIAHRLGYLPTYFIASTTTQGANWLGGIYPTPQPFLNTLALGSFSSVASKAFADTVNIAIRGVQSALAGTYAYLILKDPVVLGE